MGFSEQPTCGNIPDLSGCVPARLSTTAKVNGPTAARASTNHIVYTEFKSMLSQSAEAHRIAPWWWVRRGRHRTAHAVLVRARRDVLFESLLPADCRCTRRCWEITASELASRQRAVKSATDATPMTHQADADGKPRAAGPDRRRLVKSSLAQMRSPKH